MYSFLDKCQSTDGWILSGIMSGLDTNVDHRGRGVVSIEFDKSSNASPSGYATKTIPSVNISPFMNNGILSFYIYLSDLTDVDRIQFSVGTSGDTWTFSIPDTDLNTGWTHVKRVLRGTVGPVIGPADPNNINYIQFGIVMDNAADLLSDIRLNDIEVITRNKIIAV